MRFTRKPRREEGIALVIVMVTIFVLAALAGAFALAMKVETKLARNSTSEMELEWLGRSGVELARYVLALQLNVPDEPYDAPNQVWAGGTGSMSISNSPLANISLKDHKLGNGTYSVTITDCERKFNINTAVTSPEIMEQAFILMGADAGEAPQIIAAIQDWVDPDDDPHIGGAESSFYQGMSPPYLAKNGPIDDISELLLIRGVTPEMYWGNSNSPAASPLTGTFANQSPLPTVGLVNLFTPISSGKINPNTASAEVFMMIPGVDQNLAEQMVQARMGQDGQTPVGNPANTLVNFLNTAVGSGLWQSRGLDKYFEVRSHVFEVDVEASVAGYTRHFCAIVARASAQDLPVLVFHAK